MTPEDRLVATLRGVLEDRDPGPSPERLRRLVADVPASPPPSRWASVRGGLDAATATVLLAAAVAVLAMTRGGAAVWTSGPGGASAAPLAPGMGLVHPLPAIGPFVVIALVLGVGAFVPRRLSSPRIGRLTFAAAVVVSAAYGAVGQTDVVGWRDGAYTPGSAIAQEQPDGRDAYLLLVSARTPTRMALTITNMSPFPTVLRGLAAGEPSGPAMPSFVGLGRLAAPGAFEPATALEFEPVELAPGGQVDVVALIDPGPCASSPGPGVAAVVIDRLPLVTSTLGWDRVTDVLLPWEARVPIREGCTG